MIIKRTQLLISFYIFALSGISTALFSEEDLDAQFLEAGNANQDIDGANKPNWGMFGYLENENYLNISEKKVIPERDIIKLETRARLNFKYGSLFNYGLFSGDIFFYPLHRSNFNPQENKDWSIEPYEFYIAFGEKLQFKLGKQVFNWGSADAFRITNYLDTRDLRELFMKEEDERYRGNYAFDIKYLTGDISFEAAILPVITPVLFPAPDSYWAIRQPPIHSLEPRVDNSSMPEPSYKNISVGVRSGGTISFFDFYLSFYRGINTNILFFPQTVLSMLQVPQAINLKLDYSLVTKYGADGAFTIGRFSIRTEVMFSPDQKALVKSDTSSSIQLLNGTPVILLEQKRESAPIISYTGGIDYIYDGNSGRFLIEYSSSRYLKNKNKYVKEFFTDFLFISLENKFYNDHLELKGGSILRPISKNPGWAPAFSISWNFLNGLKVSLGSMMFSGGDDTLIQMFENNDIAYLKAKKDF